MLWDGSAILGGDAPEAALAAAVELNLAARVRFFAAEPGVQLVDDAEALRFIAERAYRVARARFDDEWAEQRITAYLTEARRRPRFISWVVGPISRPRDLARRLQARGLIVDMQEPGMVARLSALRPPRPARDGSDAAVNIYRIDPADPIELMTFTDVASASFRRPISMGGQLRRMMNALGSGHPHLQAMHLYLARRPNGEAVASGAAFVGGGVVGLYTIGTLPAYRRKGIASQLTHKMLTDAHADGLEVAVLHASEHGRGVYTRLGFEPVCQMAWLSTY